MDGFGDIINVPCKTTTDTDWIVPCRNLFKLAKVQKNYEIEIGTLNTLRSQVINLTGDKIDTNMLDTIQIYYDQIGTLEEKIPSDLLKIEFTWMDAFDKGSFFSGRKYLSLPFIAYERMCILFNIGAIQSQLAASKLKLSQIDDDELKLVIKYLQGCSGIFHHLSNMVTCLPEDALTSDLHPTTLTVLSNLFLAQAQEMFVQKAVKGKMKDSVIAKLSAQAEELFSETLAKMTKQNIKVQFERSWINQISGKKCFYGGLAQYHQSRICSSSKLIGEEIARLNIALDLLKKANEKIGSSATAVGTYISSANRFLSVSQKDNDFIYHEVVPAHEKLDVIEKTAIAKATLIQPRLSSTYEDIFVKLSSISLNASGKPVAEEILPEDKSDGTGASLKNTLGFLPKPFKHVMDASLSAMSKYLNNYLESQKSDPNK